MPTTRLVLAAATIAALFTPAAASAADIVLVANKRDNTLTILDAAAGQLLATLPTGDGPHEVAVSPDGRTAVVTNYGGQGGPGSSLTIVDLATRAVTATISLGEYRRPHGAAFLGSNTLVAVTSETNQAVVIVDLERGAVTGAIPTTQRGSHMIVVRADARIGFTANIPDGSVTEIDLAGRTTGRMLKVGTTTEGVGVTPDGSQVWVGSNDQHKVYVVDAAAMRIIDTLDAPGLPYRIGITANGKFAVVPSPMADVVRIFDVATRAQLAAVAMPPGAQPVGVALSADSRRAYIACQGNSSVQIVDLDSGRITGTLPTGAGPDGIAVVTR